MMGKAELILPRIPEKHSLIQGNEKTKSRKEIVEERIRKRRAELKAVCPPINASKNIMDIERKTLAPLIGPLVEWQTIRAPQELPDVSLRLQETKVEEWLLRNHFRIARLPRLDPIILTNRGSNFDKYSNFVFPAPYCLRFQSKGKHHKISYTEALNEIRELCPRLLRTHRDNRDLFNLNPVVRVGGGYRRLSWRTAEVLPSIGQTEKDVNLEFTCVTCGINLAVTQEVPNAEAGKKFIVTYPNICANCGKPVNRRQNKSHARDSHALPPLKDEKSRLTSNYEDRDYELDWHRESTTGIPDDRNSEYDTGLSFTPDDSVFITEQDGSTICLITKSSRDQHHHDDVSRDQGNSSRELNIVEHRDPKSGIRIRLKKKSIRNSRGNSMNSGFPNGEGTGDDYRDGGGMDTNEAQYSRDEMLTNGFQYDTYDRVNSSETESGYGNSTRTLSSRRRKPKSRYSIYYQERNAKSDSELQIPSERYLFLNRIRKNKKTSNKRTNRRGSQRSGKEFDNFSKKIKATRSQKIEDQSYAIDESLASSEEWDRVGTGELVGTRRENANSSSLVEMRKRKEKLQKERENTTEQIEISWNSDSEMHKKRSAKQRKSSKQRNFAKHQKQSGKQRKKSQEHSKQVAQREHQEEYAHGYLDGYTADSEEESLMKLQAQLQQIKNTTRKKSSRKVATSGRKDTKANTRKKSATKSAKKTTKKNASVKNPKASLIALGLDSDSWDSDVSLHVGPINDEYFFPDEEHEGIAKYGRPRALSFDISDLPSYRKNAGFYELSPSPRAMTMYKRGFYTRRKNSGLQWSHEEGDEPSPSGTDVLAIEWNDDTDLSGQPRGSHTTRHRYTSRKYPRKIYKSVPLKTTQAGAHGQYRSKWNDDNLSADDINLLTAQLQNSFTPKLTKTQTPELICKGQSCFRCGTFIDDCEGTCTACGTHCKRSDAPCIACRDTCDRCGKPKFRCESRADESRDLVAQEHDGMHDEGIGMKIDDMAGEDSFGDNYFYYEDQGKNDEDIGSEIASTEYSSVIELTSDGKYIKRKRRAIKKKQKTGADYRRRPGTRQRTSTFDSTDTLMEETTIASTTNSRSEGEEILEELHDESNDFTVSKPEKSKYTKSTKKFKSSKQVVSQTVVYKNKKGEIISRDNSLEKVDENQEDDGENNENATEQTEPQAIDGAQEESAQEPHNERNERSGDEKSEKERGEVEVKENTKEEEAKKDEVIEEKPKPQIPKPKLRGVHRVNAAYKDRVELNKRLQSMLKEALSNVIAEADIKVRRDSTIDYLAQYRLVDRSKIEVYGRAFTLEDEDEKGIISYEQMLLALEGVPTIQGMSRQQLNYVLQVLEINTFSRISFKMFAVITALCEKVTSLDPFVRDIVEGLDLTETEWKLDLYKDMFYVAGDRSVTFIKPDDLRIELKAGGLNQRQEDHVIRHIMQSAKDGQISFIDYMAYLPLFLSIHQNICTNALDMSRDKYAPRRAKTLA